MESHEIEKEQKEEAYFEKHHIHPRQEKFIDGLAELFCATMPFSIHVMRGNIFRACKKWQLKNRKPFSSTIDLGKAEMFKFWIQFISLIIEVTKRVIKTENELNFERKLSEAYTMYQTQFSNS